MVLHGLRSGNDQTTQRLTHSFFIEKDLAKNKSAMSYVLFVTEHVTIAIP